MSMITIVRLVIGTGLLATMLASGVTAQDDYEINYDVYLTDSCLTTWLDLAPLLTSRSVQRLRDGIDLALECRAELQAPRRFWGDRSIAATTRFLRLSYREVTSDFRLTARSDSLLYPARQFSSLASLHAFFRDSVELCIAPRDTIDPDQHCFLSLRVTTISLFDINLSHPETDPDGSESALKYLFRQFLRLTDYGRNQYSVRSDDFQITDLETGP